MNNPGHPRGDDGGRPEHGRRDPECTSRSLYLFDLLPPSDRARYEAHLEGCDECAGWVYEHEPVVPLACAGLRLAGAPMPAGEPAPRLLRARAPVVSIGLAVACAAAAILALWVVIPGQPPPRLVPEVTPPRPAVAVPAPRQPPPALRPAPVREVFEVGSLRDGQRVRAGTSLVIEGRHSLPEGTHVWPILLDGYGNRFLQDPAVEAMPDGTWRAPHVQPSRGIREVEFVRVTPDGDDTLRQMVRNGAWGAFHRLPRDSRVIARVRITVIEEE